MEEAEALEIANAWLDGEDQSVESLADLLQRTYHEGELNGRDPVP